MPVVRYLVWTGLRREWRAWTGLALLVGLVGGLVLALLAGADRTQSSYARLLDRSRPWDAFAITGVPGVFDFAVLDLDEVARLPQVIDATQVHAAFVIARTEDGEVLDPATVNFMADPEGRYGDSINTFTVLEGRLADPTRPEEIVAGVTAAEQFDLEVGEQLDAPFASFETVSAAFGPDPASALTDPEPLRVVGIVAAPSDFPPLIDLQGSMYVYVTPAALAAHPEGDGFVRNHCVAVRVGPGSVEDFLAELNELGGGQSVVVVDQRRQTGFIQQAIDPSARALRVAGFLAAAVGALLLGQLLVRQATQGLADDRTLVSLGLRPRQLGLVKLGQTALIALAGAVLAVGVAFLLSPLFPIGAGRDSETDPGFALDGWVLGGALLAVAVVVVLGAAAAVVGVRAVGRPTDIGPRRPAWAARTAAALGLPPAAVAGTTLTSASGGRRSDAVPLWASLGSVVLGVVTVSGVAVFVSSLGHLEDSPPLYGWTFDVRVGQDFAEAFDERAQAFLAEDPAVRALAIGDEVPGSVGSETLDIGGYSDRVGTVRLALTEGREPRGENDLVLGANRLGDLEIGDDVTVEVGERVETFAVVGRAALAEGDAHTTFEGLRRLAPGATAGNALVDLEPGTDLQAFHDRVVENTGLLSQPGFPIEDDEDFGLPRLPTELRNFGRADAIPVAIAALMALVGLGTLVHVLVVTVRRRRRDLAVLRTIGFTRSQVLTTVTVQSTLHVTLALAIGMPLGLVAGRAVWGLFAEEIGVVSVPVMPALTLLGVAVGVLIVGNLVGLAPASRAARVSPATTLRSE